MMSFWPGFWPLSRDPSSWVLVNVQHSWISLAVECIEGTQMEHRVWLSTSAGFLEVSNYFFSELAYCYLVVRILNFVSFLMRMIAGAPLTLSVACFQVTDVEIQPAEYWVALVTVIVLCSRILKTCFLGNKNSRVAFLFKWVILWLVFWN